MRRAALVIAATLTAAMCAALGHAAGPALIFTIAGDASGGFRGDGGPATVARLNGPAGLAAAPDGSLYVADTINQRIRRIDSKGRIATIAGTGKRGFAGDGGPATKATFQDPTALALAPDGSLYVADTANSRLRVIRPDGSVQTVAGTSDQGFSGDGGPASRAQVSEPGGVAVGPDGAVWFSDTGNNRVRRIAADGTIATVAGTGSAAYSGDDGPATSAKLNAPAGLAFMPDGSLLVADSGNNRIRRIAPGGVITTFAGTGAAGSAGDTGRARLAQLNDPLDVAADSAGVIYIAEMGANRIRVVTPSGTILRLAGQGGPRYGGDGDLPSKALLNAPRALEVFAGGTAIADSDNNRIRYVAAPSATTPVLALAPKRASITARLRPVKVKVKGHVRRTLVVDDVPLPYVVTRPARIAAVLEATPPPGPHELTAKARPGVNALHLPVRWRRGAHRLVKDHYVVTMTATANGRRATRSFELVVK